MKQVRVGRERVTIGEHSFVVDEVVGCGVVRVVTGDDEAVDVQWSQSIELFPGVRVSADQQSPGAHVVKLAIDAPRSMRIDTEDVE